MSMPHDLLIEVGTEELPPLALRRLRDAFRSSLERLLAEHHLQHGACHAYASPRRLALHIEAVPSAQPDREVLRRGPALASAFDSEGRPTRPAEGFARSCGVAIAELEELQTDKGRFLAYRSVETGKPAAALLPDLIEQALKTLPVPRRMRWGASEVEFVRPVHWVLLLLGTEAIEAKILGIPCDRYTRGHRFHHNERIMITEPAAYAATLRHTGMVLADLDQRRETIRSQVEAAARDLGGRARIDSDLLDEVTALVEWPVAVTGKFERRFLEVPAEALVSSMQDHQKFFPVEDADGALMPNFITVANIDSKDPRQVQAGNERVIRSRLEDAAFFWNQDRRQSLDSRSGKLDSVTFQQQLGSLGDKQKRIGLLASAIAEAAGFDNAPVQRAAELCKCDLLTSMVFEFPELQGIMGCYYALHDGEDGAVATALYEQYQPRFAGDELPATRTGQALAIADRLDTLVGIFAIGQPPTGDKDPYGLRRAALGVLRILIEKQLDLNLHTLIGTAAGNLPEVLHSGRITGELFAFMMERLRAYYLDQGYHVDIFEAVVAQQPQQPLDFDQRMRAVQEFRKLPESDSLAAANKRISNILRKADVNVAAGTAKLQITTRPARIELLKEPAETALNSAISDLNDRVVPMFEQRDYTEALRQLAALQAPVDRFFDEVMVMSDDPGLRENRLALLDTLAGLFLRVADISRLQK